MTFIYFNRPGGSRFLFFFWLFLLSSGALQSQHAFTDVGAAGAYIQDFETFDGTEVTLPANWSNSFNDYNPGGFYSNTGPWQSALSTYALNQDGTGEIAIGSKIAAGGGIQTLTFSAVNSIPAGTISGFDISWDAEQYSQGGRATTLDFSFSAGGTINGATLTTATPGTPNGNLGSVIITNRSISITGLNLINGSSFSFSWTIATGSGSGDNCHMGLDNVSITANGTLPIELTGIQAIYRQKTVLLSWRTATETDNAYFSVERSTDGRSFSEIGRVTGAGTSLEPLNYTFADERPMPGTNYYRLRQVDFDGAHSYSHVVSAVAADGDAWRLYPQPAGAFLYLQWEERPKTDASFSIFDMTGRQVKSGIVPENETQYELDIADLPEGAYFLKVIAGAASTTRQFYKL
ncbi:MAG: T9SS type A sorting domain-containing protein [Saprospiraceae bacterium]|nr:T9SS type A sorting domain-containing protein [Saprospiraceae bacterium]